ncbi:MAG: NAD-dependent epimerase/dehydratase family protein [Fimbriimonadaceae bacterium]
MRVAVLGANGFFGTRAVELWLAEGIEVRPVVRSFASLARLSRWDLDCRVADARDEPSLRKAFEGCDVVVHAVAGNADVVEGTAAPALRAAHAAGVRRMVYLSSASVHGQDPPSGTTEDAPLSDRQWHWYNNAKVRAERALAAARRAGSCETVVIRPGVVWGPRSRWVTDPFEAARAGRLAVVDGGRGVVNSVFADNLAAAVALAWETPGVDGRVYFVQDGENLTWRDFYEPILAAAGRSWADVADVPFPEPKPPGFGDRVEALRGSKTMQKILPRVPSRLKRAGRAVLKAIPEPPKPEPFALPRPPAPSVSEEMARLYRCRWRLSDERARRELGYRPVRTFDEGMAITLEWMRRAGYPVAAEDGG